jgi:hypothetical protein
MKVFLAHSMKDRDLAAAVVEHLRDDGHEVARPDEMTTPGAPLSEIFAALRSANVVVAIVSGDDPNVYYELGLAAGAGVPTLVAARAGESLPMDLASVPYVRMTEDPLRDARAIGHRVKDLEGLSSPKTVEFASAEAALMAANQDLAVLERLAPSEFERLVASLFRERGYEIEEMPSARDTGADLVVRAPGDGQILLIELKKLSKQSRVSVEAVRKFLGVVSQATPGAIGVLISTCGFTPAAAAFPSTAGAPIVLRTLDELLAAKSKSELVKPKSDRALEVLTIIRAYAKSIRREDQEQFRGIYSARLNSLNPEEFRTVVRTFQDSVERQNAIDEPAVSHKGWKFRSALECLDGILEQVKLVD